MRSRIIGRQIGDESSIGVSVGTITSQSCSLSGSMNRRAIAIPSSSGMLNRRRVIATLSRTPGEIVNRVLAAEQGSEDSGKPRLRDRAAIEGTSGHESAANRWEHNGVKERCVFRIKRAIDENGLRGIERQIILTEARTSHLFGSQVRRLGRLGFAKLLGGLPDFLEPIQAFLPILRRHTMHGLVTEVS